jgi:hypothetical protein
MKFLEIFRLVFYVPGDIMPYTCCAMEDVLEVCPVIGTCVLFPFRLHAHQRILPPIDILKNRRPAPRIPANPKYQELPSFKFGAKFWLHMLQRAVLRNLN